MSFQLTDDSSSLVWSTNTDHAEKLLSLSKEDFVSAINAALVSDGSILILSMTPSSLTIIQEATGWTMSLQV